MKRLGKLLAQVLKHPKGPVIHDPVHMQACKGVICALKGKVHVTFG